MLTDCKRWLIARTLRKYGRSLDLVRKVDGLEEYYVPAVARVKMLSETPQKYTWTVTVSAVRLVFCLQRCAWYSVRAQQCEEVRRRVFRA